MRSVARWVLPALFVLGCGHAGHAPRPEVASVLAPRSDGPDGMTWIAPDSRRATTAGAGAATIVAFGAGAPGDALGGRVALPPGSCGLFLARGGASVEDLDLLVYSEDGAVVGADETGSPHASVVVCPPHPEHVYAFGRVAAGRGLFAVSAQLVAPADADRVARSVGAIGALHEAAVAEGGWPGLEPALAARRRALGGAWKDASRVAVPMDPRIETRVGARLEAGQCLDVLVLPADDVAFVELTLLDAEGRIVGRAPSDSPMPSVLACSTERTEVSLVLRPRAGRGLAAVVTSVTDDAGGISGDVPVARLGAKPIALEAARAELAARLAREGYPAARVLGKGATTVGHRVSLTVDVPGGCSRMDVIAGAEARGLEAWLWSSTGALVAHDEGADQATLFACGRADAARLDVESVTRPGPFAVELRGIPDAARALSERPLAAGRLLARLEDLPSGAGPIRAVVPHVVAVSSSSLATEQVVVPAGRCAEVAFALDRGAEGAELRLVDVADGRELALARGNHSVRAQVCAAAAGGARSVRIEARAAAGAGEGLIATLVGATTP